MAVSRPVMANLTASAASTELSAGTGIAIAVVADAPVVDAAEPPTVRVVDTAAFAAVDTSIVLVRAAAMISDTFLNEFILFFSPYLCLSLYEYRNL
jgi:hypothetical protein